jgi:hypothetical protein
MIALSHWHFSRSNLPLFLLFNPAKQKGRDVLEGSARDDHGMKASVTICAHLWHPQNRCWSFRIYKPARKFWTHPHTADKLGEPNSNLHLD